MRGTQPVAGRQEAGRLPPRQLGSMTTTVAAAVCALAAVIAGAASHAAFVRWGAAAAAAQPLASTQQPPPPVAWGRFPELPAVRCPVELARGLGYMEPEKLKQLEALIDGAMRGSHYC